MLDQEAIIQYAETQKAILKRAASGTWEARLIHGQHSFGLSVYETVIKNREGEPEKLWAQIGNAVSKMLSNLESMDAKSKRVLGVLLEEILEVPQEEQRLELYNIRIVQSNESGSSANSFGYSVILDYGDDESDLWNDFYYNYSVGFAVAPSLISMRFARRIAGGRDEFPQDY